MQIDRARLETCICAYDMYLYIYKDPMYKWSKFSYFLSIVIWYSLWGGSFFQRKWSLNQKYVFLSESNVFQIKFSLIITVTIRIRALEVQIFLFPIKYDMIFSLRWFFFQRKWCLNQKYVFLSKSNVFQIKFSLIITVTIRIRALEVQP